MNRRNATPILIGLLVSLLAGVGLFYLYVTNTQGKVSMVYVAANLPAGQPLDKSHLEVRNVYLDPLLVSSYVTVAEADQYLGRIVLKPLSGGELLPKAALGGDGNAAASQRVSLALVGEDVSAFLIPVTGDNAPASIVEGDYVDITVGLARGVRGESALPEAAAPLNTFSAGAVVPFDAAGAATPTAIPDTSVGAGTTLLMPLAKTVATNALVIAVEREQIQQPYSGPDGSASYTLVAGKVTGLVINIPRAAQEMIAFALDNGVVRISVLPPSVAGGAVRAPTLGMAYSDYVALFELDRARIVREGLPDQVLGPGAQLFSEAENADETSANSHP